MYVCIYIKYRVPILILMSLYILYSLYYTRAFLDKKIVTNFLDDFHSLLA